MAKTDAEKENEARRKRQLAVAQGNLKYRQTRAKLLKDATAINDQIAELDCQPEVDTAILNQDA